MDGQARGIHKQRETRYTSAPWRPGIPYVENVCQGLTKSFLNKVKCKVVVSSSYVNEM